MACEGWEQLFTNDLVVSVEGIGETQNRYQYEIRLPLKYETPVDIVPSGDTYLTKTERSPDTTEEVLLTVTIPLGETVERVILRIGKNTCVVYLPSPQFLDACQAVKAGEMEAASSILDTFDSPVQPPIICGAFLPVSDVLKLVEGVTTISRHASSRLHSYRYGLVRAALTSTPGLTVESMTELEEFVTGLDSVNNIGPVNLLDALGDVMTTLHDTPADTKALLNSLGADQHALERREDGFFFLSYLSKLFEAGGIEAAEDHAMTRCWWLHGNYNNRVHEAKQAEFGERGAAWRTLLCAAAQQDRKEFAYVFANACYWSAQERQTDARVSELLLSGAIYAAREIDLNTIEARAQFERRLSIAHRLRSSHNSEPALTHFRAAERLAQDHEFLPTWLARYGRGICEAHALFDNSDADAAIASLETTMEALFKLDFDNDHLNTAIHHLTAHKHEILGDSTISDTEAWDYYETARDHFETIGFDRSQDRCARKQARVETQVEELDETSAVGESLKANEREATSPEPEESVERASAVAEPLPPDIQVAETGLYPADADDEPLPDAEPDELGSTDPGVLPSEDDEDADDPYVF